MSLYIAQVPKTFINFYFSFRSAGMAVETFFLVTEGGPAF